MPNFNINNKVIYNKFQLQSETLQWIQSCPNPVCATVILCVNQFILQCKNDDNWQYLDRFWLFAQCDQTNARVSIKNPTSTTITEVNSPTWTQFQGYTGDGVSMYLNTNFNPSVNGVNYTQNGAKFGIYSRTEGQSAGYDMGHNDASVVSNIQARFTDDKLYTRLNSTAGGTTSGSNTGAVGLFDSTRTNSTTIVSFKNGNVVNSNGANTSGARPNNSIYVMCTNNNGVASGFTTRQYSMAYVGNSGIVSLKLYKTFQTLATQLGFVV